jgi:hypothetical protein
VLLLIDQLEELFTLSSAEERTQFLAALRDLRGVPRCAVIFTLRADFFGALMESPLWTEHQGEPSLLKVSPLHGEMLRDAIASPARDLGVVVEPELQLWDQRQDQTLTLDDYQALGDGERSGLAIALAHRADAALRPLTPAQKALARRILLRLISFGEGRSDTRRQQPPLAAPGCGGQRGGLRVRTAAADRPSIAHERQGQRERRTVDRPEPRDHDLGLADVRRLDPGPSGG